LLGAGGVRRTLRLRSFCERRPKGVGFGRWLWYPRDMVVVVLTGGIGSGKSEAAEYFRGRGALVLDLDDVATRLMSPGSPVLAAVAAEFGAQVLASDGSLDRSALACACFATPHAAQRLNAIVHPEVAREVETVLEQLRTQQSPPEVAVIEVPLLAEAPHFAALGDLVVAITAPEAVRAQRAVARGMERSDVLRRISVQAPDSARGLLADLVIENRGTLSEYHEALDLLWEKRLTGRGSRG
jgi:dephospho-CoA kinase